MDGYISTGSQKEFESTKNTQQIFEDALQDADSQLVVCHSCNRKFAVERLEKHSQVCMKMQYSKRKAFDSSKHRAQGTDLEQFNKNRRTISTPPKPKNNWRQKHESFIRNLQQSREVQKIVQKGGKVSDLPPLPPDDNPDYIPCPHCSRKFAPRGIKITLHFRFTLSGVDGGGNMLKWTDQATLSSAISYFPSSQAFCTLLNLQYLHFYND
uniref:Zinc finger C2HC domain-containing protein 1C-like n=1 Tax=Erpetoichthys calabaricus TaxID=27687 RepID=A0A8C4SMG8_ERPCA